MAKRTAPYKVGYGRPPRESRFEPGVSGNPKGRPKGSVSVATILTRQLKQEVAITENNRKKKVSKLEVAMMMLIRKAHTGDISALKFLISLSSETEQRQADQALKHRPLGRAEQKMLSNLMKRFDSSGKDNANG